MPFCQIVKNCCQGSTADASGDDDIGAEGAPRNPTPRIVNRRSGGGMGGGGWEHLCGRPRGMTPAAKRLEFLGTSGVLLTEGKYLMGNLQDGDFLKSLSIKTHVAVVQKLETALSPDKVLNFKKNPDDHNDPQALYTDLNVLEPLQAFSPLVNAVNAKEVQPLDIRYAVDQVLALSGEQVMSPSVYPYKLMVELQAEVLWSFLALDDDVSIELDTTCQATCLLLNLGTDGMDLPLPASERLGVSALQELARFSDPDKVLIWKNEVQMIGVIKVLDVIAEAGSKELDLVIASKYPAPKEGEKEKAKKLALQDFSAEQLEHAFYPSKQIIMALVNGTAMGTTRICDEVEEHWPSATSFVCGRKFCEYSNIDKHI